MTDLPAKELASQRLDPELLAALQRLVSTRAALEHLVGSGGRAARVALVSGRSLADLNAIAQPPAGITLVGSHGAEIEGAPRGLDETEEAVLGEIIEAVQAVVDAHPGTMREDKPAGVVLHTRNAERAVASAATAAVLNGPARLSGIWTTTGKEVVELSVIEVDKGLALHRLRVELGAGAVLYAGDDNTDETAFAILDDDDSDVTIKVGDGPTGARWRISGPEAVPALLDAIAHALSHPAH
jgi:trehalose 6-phosphate phosphatase